MYELYIIWVSQVALVVRNWHANVGDARDRFDPWVGKIWSRKWQPTLVFLPGKFHGQRNLEGYSPWGHKESATTEHISTKNLIIKTLVI